LHPGLQVFDQYQAGNLQVMAVDYASCRQNPVCCTIFGNLEICLHKSGALSEQAGTHPANSTDTISILSEMGLGSKMMVRLYLEVSYYSALACVLTLLREDDWLGFRSDLNLLPKDDFYPGFFRSFHPGFHPGFFRRFIPGFVRIFHSDNCLAGFYTDCRQP